MVEAGRLGETLWTTTPEIDALVFLSVRRHGRTDDRRSLLRQPLFLRCVPFEWPGHLAMVFLLSTGNGALVSQKALNATLLWFGYLWAWPLGKVAVHVPALRLVTAWTAREILKSKNRAP